MAEKKETKSKSPKQPQKAQEAKAEKPPAEKKQGTGGSTLKLVLIILVAAAVIAALYLILPNNLNGVNFTTFKSNFDSAPQVAIVGTYYNDSQYAEESACISSMIEVIASSGRVRSTMNFYFIDAANDSCSFSKGGLVGQNLSIANGTAGQCRALATSAPATLYLNYSSSNVTTIYATKMYAYGNGEFMAKCPIAVDLA